MCSIKSTVIHQDPNTFKLLTPGPLTTSVGVRAQMLKDRCAWGEAYKAMVEDIRAKILAIAHAPRARFAVVLMQGSGTYGVESVLSSVPGPTDRVLVLNNGAYGRRMCSILERYGIAYDSFDVPLTDHFDVAAIDAYLAQHPQTKFVAMVHNETTTGILNNAREVCEVVKRHGRQFILDCVSSFGAVDIDFDAWDIDFAITSSNKCIQGVPGFAVVICKTQSLLQTRGNARTVALDLLDQYEGFEATHGKFRFTSPTHVVAAFHQALVELEEEGGRQARYERYLAMNRVIREGLEALGFTPYVPIERQGPIITTFHLPCEHFDFDECYRFIEAQGYTMFPGWITPEKTIRIGNIGCLTIDDAHQIVKLFTQYVEMSRPKDRFHGRLAA